MPEILTRAAPVVASSWNSETWTAEAILSTGAAVTRHDHRGTFDEILALQGQAWPEMVPLLDSHRRDSLDRRVGTVGGIATTGGALHGQIRLSRSNPQSQRIAADLADGHPFGVSVGYVVTAWTERKNPANGRREKVATAWELVEASLVAVPADRQSKIRSSEMDDENDAGARAGEGDARGDDVVANRATVNAGIRSIAEIAHLDRAWADAQIDAGVDLEQARAAAFDAMRERGNVRVRSTRATIGTDYTDPEFRARTIGEALYSRTAFDHTPSEPARQYAHHTTLDIARDCLRNASISTTALSPTRTIERALHSTSDFPLIIGDSVNRTLRAAYQAVPSGLKAVGRRTTARDFREKHRLQLSEAPRLEKVNEGGEYHHGTLAEAEETYKLATFGKIIGVTRQLLVNDDVGAFADLARRMGQAALATEAQLLVELLEGAAGNGPTMSDGKALFHVDHGNREVAGTFPGPMNDPRIGAPDIYRLSSARLAMRSQVGLTGELISVTPKFLIVPAALETHGEGLLTPITPSKTEDVNRFANLMQLIVEPRLRSPTRWYVAAAASEVDGLEYAYLEGEEGPQTETRAGFEVDGVQVKVRLDFGAGFVDHRAWFQNPGA